MLEVEYNFFLSLREKILLMHLKILTTSHFKFVVFYLSSKCILLSDSNVFVDIIQNRKW